MATAEQLQIIRDYVNGVMASNPNNWVDIVTQRMDEVGVDPATLQRAFPDVSLQQIQTAYDQSRPTGTFATSQRAGTTQTLGTNLASATSRLAPEQIDIVKDFVNAAIQTNPDNWVDIVTQRMDEVGIPPEVLQQAFPNVSLADIQAGYDASRPRGTFATPGGPPAPLDPGAGESRIDPIIAPYLSEALGEARSLFLTGKQPELYPGQMFVSPSAETLESLDYQTGLVEGAMPFFQQAASGLDVGLRGLEKTASGSFLGGSPYRDAMMSAATRPLTQQFTEEVMPGIQSTFSQAGRLGSGAQGAVTGRATEGFTRALGDVTSRIAAEDYARERGFQEAATRDVISGASNLGNVFSSFLAPSAALANVGAQREAIAGQPLAESIRRFDYRQNLPQDQFAKYMASIYGSPLGARSAAPEMSGNSFLSGVGNVANIASAFGRFSDTNLGGKTLDYLSSSFF